MPGIKSMLYNEAKACTRLTVASVTLQCSLQPEANRAKMVQMVEGILEQNAGVDLVVFGEAILGWYNPPARPEYVAATAEPIPGETTAQMAELAVRYGLYLCFGMSEQSGNGVYNAQVLLDPTGAVCAVHRKRNLKERERGIYRSGSESATFTRIKGVETAMLVCSDAASPATVRALMQYRPELILLSLADDRDDDWFMAKLNARLYDAWIVTANRYGREDDWFWNGHTTISDPLGTLRSCSVGAEQVLLYEIAFDASTSRLKRLARNAIVKAPLAWHLASNWRRLREYL